MGWRAPFTNLQNNIISSSQQVYFNVLCTEINRDKVLRPTWEPLIQKKRHKLHWAFKGPQKTHPPSEVPQMRVEEKDKQMLCLKSHTVYCTLALCRVSDRVLLCIVHSIATCIHYHAHLNVCLLLWPLHLRIYVLPSCVSPPPPRLGRGDMSSLTPHFQVHCCDTISDITAA